MPYYVSILIKILRKIYNEHNTPESGQFVIFIDLKAKGFGISNQDIKYIWKLIGDELKKIGIIKKQLNVSLPLIFDQNLPNKPQSGFSKMSYLIKGVAVLTKALGWLMKGKWSMLNQW